MEQFAALLVPLLFGGMLFTSIFDSDEEETPESEPGPDPEPGPESKPEPEPQPVTLDAGDGSFIGTDDADIVIANAAFQGNVDGGAGNDTLTGHGTPT